MNGLEDPHPSPKGIGKVRNREPGVAKQVL
jgi:hypothetical protein